ncbi:hypothetical protein KJ918_05150, partial [Patescibacteria group bacterium]|nr:hypothetical protein [Patescibacteria group bacterium]
IKHSVELFNILTRLCKSHDEKESAFFCETDMIGMTMSLVQTQVLTLEQKLEMQLAQEIRMLQQLATEDEYDSLERRIPPAWRKFKQIDAFTRSSLELVTLEFEYEEGFAEDEFEHIWESAREEKRIKWYRKHGFYFEYAVIMEKDYGDDTTFKDIMRRDCGLAHYSESAKRYFLMVDAASFPEEFTPEEYLEYVAIHERGHELLGDHHQATLLEFAIAAKEGKTKKYIKFLEKYNPQKFANVITYVNKRLPKKIEDSQGYSEYKQKQGLLEEYKMAKEMVDSFEWPKELVLILYIYERLNKEAEQLLESAFRIIGYEVENWSPAKGTFVDFAKHLNSLLTNAIEEINKRGHTSRLNLERIRIQAPEYARKYIGAKLHERWNQYRKFKQGDIRKTDSPEMIDEMAQCQGLEFMSLEIKFDNIIAALERKQNNVSPRSLPGITSILRMEEIEKTIIEEQQEYLKTGEIEDLEPLTKTDIANQTDIDGGTVTKLLKEKKEIIFQGKKYPLSILIPAAGYKKLQLWDMLEKMWQEDKEQFAKSMGKKGAKEFYWKIRNKLLEERGIVVEVDTARKLTENFVKKKLQTAGSQAEKIDKKQVAGQNIAFIEQAI